MSSQTGGAAKPGQAKEDCSEEHSLYLKITSQLEYYLSNCHLAKDGFLLKHVQKNKLGYVSLKLLTSFKRVRALTKDWHVTLAGAHCSKLLEVNEEGTKVRRREPLPKWLLSSPTSRLILAWNLCGEQTGEDGEAQDPEQQCPMKRLFKKFSAFGNISSLWILHPGKALPNELQCYAKRHGVLGRRLCAVVKFDCLDEARAAYSALKAEEANGKGMCVVPLGCPEKPYFTQEELQEEADRDPAQVTRLNHETSNQEFASLQESSEDSPPEKSAFPVKDSDKSPSGFQPEKPQAKAPGDALDSFSTNHRGQPIWRFGNRANLSNGSSGDHGQERYGCPWVQRRKDTASGVHPEPAGPLSKPSMTLKMLRLPRGPDGTKGFHGSRAIGKPLQEP
ncbi:la-related protein 6b [Myripristis murdjan]|uniref:la-related protein 6b n=1 Tax=Myripristis murdjan TaxID=586833 RepID=UPI001175D7AC|nr:la-related protein 6-like [Myripristis murdjan]